MTSRDIAGDSMADSSSRKVQPARGHGQNDPLPQSKQHAFDRNDYARREPVRREYTRIEPLARDYREHEHAERGTSWASVMLAWLTSLGAGVILAGLIGGIVDAMPGAGDTARAAASESGTTGLVITLFLAFLIGGYCAGRMASRAGVKHGLLVAALALSVTVVLAVVGAMLDTSFIDSLSGVTLPKLSADAPRQSLGTILTFTGIIALLIPFVGGALGGMWGANTGRQRP